MDFITDRMALGLEGVVARKRRPKAFYLGPADWVDFLSTNPPTVESLFGNNPPRLVVDPAFEGVPVRQSVNVAPRKSRLYDDVGMCRLLPDEDREDRRKLVDAARLARMDKMRTSPRRQQWLIGMDLVASLGDGGLWSWKSSPHVLWLANALLGRV